MANYYCEYCGVKDATIFGLTSTSCNRHPSGFGKHKLYEGSEKSSYSCKYCGISAPSIFSLTGSSCFRHPRGSGKHAPAL